MHIILLNKLRFDQISSSGRMYALTIWGAHVLRDREKVGNPCAGHCCCRPKCNTSRCQRMESGSFIQRLGYNFKTKVLPKNPISTDFTEANSNYCNQVEVKTRGQQNSKLFNRSLPDSS